MVQPLIGFLVFALGIVVVAMAPVVAAWLVVQALKAITVVTGGTFQFLGAATGRVLRFVAGTIADSLRFAGSVITAIIVLPMAVANLGLFRFSAAKHYGAAAEDELLVALACVYRVVIGHPVRLLGLSELTDGLERRLPDLVEGEPTLGSTRAGVNFGPLASDRGSEAASNNRNTLRRAGRPAFRGYELLEELQAGGSGARLFVALPLPSKVREWEARELSVPTKVVIKAFDLGYGSTIPQIVRESRSLEAAKSLGLLLDHEFEEDAFHYVMPFVPGVSLDTATRELHAGNNEDGLGVDQLRTVIGYARDLCTHLSRFHVEGLWHKDIKPSNLMVAEGHLEVVDFGLVTPLESALTLTTHGTEYFRDPELVRMAMAGRKVRDVDGVKFDLYSAGAVIFSMLENTFPAHGSLSSLSKPAPAALRWIVRRAMADIDKRYCSAEEFGRDLDVLLAADDPNEVKPADLPSVSGALPPPLPLRLEPRQELQDAADVHRAPALGASSASRKNRTATRTFTTTRMALRERRREARRARDAAKLARLNVRRTSQDLRRRRGRGVLKALAVLLVFGGLIGGTMEFTSARWPDADNHGPDVAAGILDATPGRPSTPTPIPEEAVLHTSVVERLSNLTAGERVLLVADPADPKIGPELKRIAARVRSLDLKPVGFAGDETSTSPANIALLSAALLSLEQRRSGQSERECLQSLLDGTPAVAAVLYLSEETSGRGLRTLFETKSDQAGKPGTDEQRSGASRSPNLTSSAD